MFGYAEVTIAEISSISRGKVISKDDITANPGDYPVYSSQTENIGELGRINTFMFDGEYLTWTTDGVNAGTVFYRSGKFNVTNVCGLIEVNPDLAVTKYLLYALQIEAPKYVNSGMGNPKLMSNVMARIRIQLPSINDQKQIADTLDRFNTLCNDINHRRPPRRDRGKAKTIRILQRQITII